MAIPALTHDGDLRHFPGGPYPAPVVRAAEKSVRGEAGWHIAPVIRETVTVVGTGGWKLFLPTLRVVTIHSVTDDALVPVAGWRLRHHRAPHLVGGWWADGESVLVDMTHGFDDADDLLPVVAGRCQQQLTDAALTQRSETVGTRTSSESYNVGRIAAGGDSALDRYRLSPVA